MTGNPIEPKSQDEIDFLKVRRELTDFDVGLCVPSKLMPKTINGGVVLKDTFYQMR